MIVQLCNIDADQTPLIEMQLLPSSSWWVMEIASARWLHKRLGEVLQEAPAPPSERAGVRGEG